MTQPIQKKTQRKPTQKKLLSLDYSKLSITEVKKYAAHYTKELDKIRQLIPGLVTELNNSVSYNQQQQMSYQGYQPPHFNRHIPPSPPTSTETVLSGEQFGNDYGNISFRPVEPKTEIMDYPVVEDNSSDLETELKNMLSNE